MSHTVPIQSLIDHIKTAVDVDPWAKEMAEELLKAHDELENDAIVAMDVNYELNQKLKEQEPVAPRYNARTNWYECGNCRFSMTSGMHCRGTLIPAYKVGFCAKCGREQKWK